MPEEAFQRALVRIYTSEGAIVGMGFLVSSRQVLTCAHVVEQALQATSSLVNSPITPITLDFPLLAPQKLLKATIDVWYPVQADGRGDLAGLTLLENAPMNARPVRWALTNDIWHHPFRTFGCPSGYDHGVWSSGRLLDRDAHGWISMEDTKTPGPPVEPGFSGGPVWDDELQGVVGMIVATDQNKTRKTAFAMSTEALMNTLPALAALIGPPILRNPYKGLHAFTTHDAGDFFGREKLISELTGRIEAILTPTKEPTYPTRLLAVIGNSGSGKSSVVMAGLLPRLLRNSTQWLPLPTLYPGPHPLEALAIVLAKQHPTHDIKAIHEQLTSNAPEAPRTLHQLISLLSHNPQQKVLLFIDQFEEVFTQTTSEDERQRFFELLITAIAAQHSPIFVILTLRADFYHQLLLYRKLYGLIEKQHVSVLPMEKADLRDVIEKPAALADVRLTFEPGLVEELLAATQEKRAALPLLQFTLAQLVQQCEHQRLTLRAYHEMGGVVGALSRHADETYRNLPTDEHRQAARTIFLRLIKLDLVGQNAATRRRANIAEFILPDVEKTQQIQETIGTFTQARLLTTSEHNGQATVEVSHEALIEQWERLKDWLREAHRDILTQQSLDDHITAWEQHKKSKDRLYRGTQLKEAQDWASRNTPSKQEAAFLKASTRQRIFSRVSAAILGLVLLFSLGVAGWFFVTRPPDPTLVTTLQDNVYGSLRYCIENAPTGSTIRFAQGLHGTINLKESLGFQSGEQLTIQGPGAKLLTISGATNSDANVLIPPHATITFSDLSFKNSQTIGYAFLFNEEGSLTVENSIISDNMTKSSSATAFGGGIYNLGTLTVKNSTLLGNKATSVSGTAQGGGIDNEGKLFISNSSSISQNVAMSTNGNSFGGGIDNSGTVTVQDSTVISQNMAMSTNGNSSGGGIDNSGTVTVSGSTTISGNSSSGGEKAQGGGIDNDGTLIVSNSSSISQNMAMSTNGNSFGGGIANSKTGTVTVSDSSFSGNEAESMSGNVQGGGIDNDGKLIVSNSSSFSQNVAMSTNGSSFGGGIYNSSIGTVSICGSMIDMNQATNGSDIYGIPPDSDKQEC